ncbi:MAG TPA: SsrA-binding protein SmpB [Salinivirgaceae bacterium]|nr:SsrA-binding protein SmpB [Salinivirgaceae bacterium]
MANVEIKNKRASFEYEFIETFIAGIVLKGTEIKSIRQGKASLVDSYCIFHNGELFAKGIHIAEYEKATHFNHDPRTDRKLLLTQNELRRLERKVKERGMTIIPISLFINDRGWAKLKIALARGKKVYDKRESIKEKDMKRENDRFGKIR